MQTSDWVAFGSFAISLFALWVSWLGYRRDRGRVTLKIEKGTNLMSPSLILRVINSGRRPVIIARVFARTSRGDSVPVAESQRKVDESESIEYIIPTSSLQAVVTSLIAEDSLGKKHQIRTSLAYRIRYKRDNKYPLEER